MKLTPNIWFDVCRSYIEDNKAALTDVDYKKVSGWIRSRNLQRLASAASVLDPTHSMGRDRLRVLLQVEAFFKKNAAYADGTICDAAALRSFRASEKLCRITNRRLDHYYIHRDRLDPDVEKWMVRAEAYVRRVLGPFSRFVDALPGEVRLTSGATATRSRKEALPVLKVHPKIPTTTGAIPYVDAIARWYGYKVSPRPLDCNRVEFVPKNWKTSRTIACEPDGSLPLQLAFDSYVKRRLRLVAGIDLRLQSRNQDLAKEGSLTDALCTVDLSAASDTIAYNAVAWLLPLRW
jgi:hypothetical protein